MEAGIALAALHTRFPRHGDGLVLRGLSELPIMRVADALTAHETHERPARWRPGAVIGTGFGVVTSWGRTSLASAGLGDYNQG